MIEQTFLAKAAEWLMDLLPSIFGSLISLKFTGTDVPYLSRLFSFFSGVVISHYITFTLVEVFKIDPTSITVSSISFTTALFGMSFATELSKQLPDLVRGFVQKLVNLLK